MRGKPLEFNQPAIYEISVIGNLDKSWAPMLVNMQISLEENLGKRNSYVLIGKLKDQAELHGILSTLYECHLSLTSVKILDHIK